MSALFKRTFNFRTISAAKLKELPQEIEGTLDVSSAEAIAANFEIVESDANGNPTKYKRKPVNVELEAPDFIGTLPDELSRTLIQNYIADFVKSAYVDQFAPIGQHDWETIVTESQSSRGTSAISISDTALQLSAESFGNWVFTDTQSKELGSRIAGLVLGKVTQASITKHLGQCTLEVVEKLEARTQAWAEYVANSGDDNAEELAQGFDYITHKLDKLKRKFTGDVGDLVANVL